MKSSRARLEPRGCDSCGALEHTIRVYLHGRGMAHESILASADSYAVVVARMGAGNSLVTLRYNAGSVREVGQSVPLANMPLPEVQLLLVGAGTILRVVRFDNPVEGVVGTVVDRISGGELVRTYSDPANICRAADVSRYGGVVRIKAYLQSPFADDCSNACAEALRSIMQTEPARITDLAFTGGQFVPERVEPVLSTHDAYERAVVALRSGKVPVCSSRAAELARMFANAY